MQIQYFAEIVSEFSGFHHTPGFKASRSTGDFEKFSGTKNSRRASTESTTSNHSIRIPVGVDDVPILSTTSSKNHPHFTKNFATSPSISRMASLSRVQEKLQRKIKRSKSEESLESLENQNSRKSSTTTSYRLLMRMFLFSFVAQFFTIPLLIINTYISAQVYLIISKLRPEYDGDDSYEVIEGSEGSSTKKIDLS
ncbi:hypothetical protein GCK72_021485 [Caenorhabditis remanei]|uniref:Uncharacterized protein n=1 Tax=Caenorhabditis remanei TaxID=31234 RepID=A0A6A5GIA5_CAERE|nr:hypothetical protein GCK72_021485 [Caenorhabditis remanei]KAF1754920.1 hypothetical protein GCK72_021485 [Caenorhabditis remanei]